jgi:ribosome-associated protein
MQQPEVPVTSSTAEEDLIGLAGPMSLEGGASAASTARGEHRPTHTAEELERIRQYALLAAAAASELKAEDIRLLDMHELVTYTDYLVLCTGRSNRQTRRVSEEIGFKLKKELGLMPRRVEADTGYEWILMDYLDFIVHVFTPQTREFYRLDVLWKEAPVQEIE